MAKIELRQAEKRFGEFQAVKPMDLIIDDREFIVLLGPSGCGKTTTLRMISGLETVSGGTIWLDSRNVTWLHPSERDIAFVFQFYALYPHLSAYRNIAFPLQAQGESSAEIEKRVKEVVDLLQIGHLLDERPGKLSGGDQQRIALARALVRRPAAFLMDEPLGALDADFREEMRAEIKRLHIAQEATTVYVTHDQVEAMAMSDRIVVMSDAEVQQVGTPAEVYFKPQNLFVSRFIGSPGMNLVTGQLGENQIKLSGERNTYHVPTTWQTPVGEELGREAEIIIGFRPESAYLSDQGQLSGEVYATEMQGAYTILHVNINSHEIVHIRTDRQVDYDIGSVVKFDIDPEMVRFFNPVTEMAIHREVSA